MEQNKIEHLLEKIKDLSIDQGKIISAEILAACTPEPYPRLKLCPIPDCLKVKVELTPSADSVIRVEVWLPIEGWNGRYLGTGNGGKAGNIVDINLINGVSRGYAAANTDLGTAPELGTLYQKTERWKDFGYRATHLMTVIAKQIIRVFYGQDPEYSFFIGSSTGGQQALMEAQRYPEDYDGIIALSPAWNRTRLHTRFIKNWQICRRVKKAFDQELANLITGQIVKAYGEQSGGKSKDRYLTWPFKVKLDMEIFDELVKNGQLSPDQKQALHDLYLDLRDPKTGEFIYPGMVPGSEANDIGLACLGDTEQFAKDYFFPYHFLLGEEYDFEKFDFHEDYQRAKRELAPYLDADSADLTEFYKKGGKLILAAGTADPIIPYTDTDEYYRRVRERMGEKTEKFMAYYLVPGLGHFSGPGVQDIGAMGLPQIPRDREHDVIANL